MLTNLAGSGLASPYLGSFLSLGLARWSGKPRTAPQVLRGARVPDRRGRGPGAVHPRAASAGSKLHLLRAPQDGSAPLRLERRILKLGH